MEQFNPEIRIVAVDQGDVVVMFDSASEFDAARSPKALRISRKFSELSIDVGDFVETVERDGGMEYRGEVSLVVKSALNDEVKHTLAAPVLWIKAASRNRKKGAVPYNFYSASDVTMAVRVGVATALGHALAEFFEKEDQLDSFVRMPAQAAVAQTISESRAAQPGGRVGLPVRQYSNASPAANKQQFRKKVLLAAVVAPLAVYGLLWLGGTVAKKPDPIQNAVARVMKQDPKSMQAQVELTKETLKQMGLDPGKSGDIGCLAPQ